MKTIEDLAVAHTLISYLTDRGATAWQMLHFLANGSDLVEGRIHHKGYELWEDRHWYWEVENYDGAPDSNNRHQHGAGRSLQDALEGIQADIEMEADNDVDI